jgi:hypothetical protein
MKLNKFARVLLFPAAYAAIAASSWAVFQAVSSHPSDHVHARQVRHAGHSRQGGHRAWAAAASEALDQLSRVRMTHSAKVIAGAAHPAHAQANHGVHANGAHRAARNSAALSSTSMFAGMSAFERCVAWRESGDNPTASSAGLFGILPSTWASLGYPGTAGQASVAMQKAAFNRLYAKDGTSPWAPYDGC